MTESTDKDLWVSWDEYHRAIERLALQVHESGWKFDQVLCLARGGLRPGDIFSRIFDVPLAILSTSSYREDAGTVRGDLDIAKLHHDDQRRAGRAKCCWSMTWSIPA